MVTALFIILAFVAFSVFYLRGENLRYLDTPLPPPDAAPPSDAHREVVRASRVVRIALGLKRGRCVHRAPIAPSRVPTRRDTCLL